MPCFRTRFKVLNFEGGILLLQDSLFFCMNAENPQNRRRTEALAVNLAIEDYHYFDSLKCEPAGAGEIGALGKALFKPT